MADTERAGEVERMRAALRNVLALVGSRRARLRRGVAVTDRDLGRLVRFCAGGGVAPSPLRETEEHAAAQTAEAQARAWRSVADELPEEGRIVAVVVTYRGKPAVATGRREGGRWTCSPFATFLWPVTHWATLPPLPREDDRG